MIKCYTTLVVYTCSPAAETLYFF